MPCPAQILGAVPPISFRFRSGRLSPHFGVPVEDREGGRLLPLSNPKQPRPDVRRYESVHCRRPSHVFTSMPPASDLIALAHAAAAAHELDAALVCAVIEQESAWDTDAIRYEPAFRTRYVAPLGLPPTEEVARSISWGLMQVMGQVAREHCFSEKFLSALCDPAIGIDIGCAVLAAKIASANDNTSRALDLWNGGANPDYAAQVLARCPHYR
jgi:soluble lytic murein transglycosylase-like protein